MKHKTCRLPYALTGRDQRLTSAVDDDYIADLEGGLARYLGYHPTRSQGRIMAAALAPVETMRGWMAEGLRGQWAAISPLEYELGAEAGARLWPQQLTLLCDTYVHGRSRAYSAERIRRESKGRVRLTDEAVQKRIDRARQALFRSVAKAIQ